jgi:predicted RNase H-like nuclease (RuvC/YqgF family)
MPMLPNEQLHDELKRLGTENFHLKNQLRNKNKHIKNLKHALKRFKDSQKKDKQHFKNGKRGTMKNG